MYTDGSCDQGSMSQSTDKGGWSFLIVDDKDNKIILEDSGFESNTTNNKCEMLAVINGISKFKELNLIGGLTVHCDSAYVVNAFKDKWIDKWISNGWKNSGGTDVLNKEYWVKLISLVNGNKVDFNKVKRNSNIFSKKVDSLARKKMKS